MHEMALAEELIHIIEDSASAEQFRRVKDDLACKLECCPGGTFCNGVLF